MRILLGVAVPLGTYVLASGALLLSVPYEKDWTGVGAAVLAALLGVILMIANWWVVLIRWKDAATVFAAGIVLPAYAVLMLYLVAHRQAAEKIVKGWFSDTWQFEPVAFFLVAIALFFVPLAGAIVHVIVRPSPSRDAA